MAVTDILVTPATIYYAPVGETLPDETSVAYGEAWGGNWVNLGYTLDPVAWSVEKTTFELEVEQLSTAVRSVTQTETSMIETNLAEFTGSNIALATGGTVTTTAAGVGQVGFDEITGGGSVDLSEYAWGFEGFRITSGNVRLPVRLFFYRGIAVVNGQLTFAKSAGVGIPLQVKALADTTKDPGEQLWVIHNVTAVATTA